MFLLVVLLCDDRNNEDEVNLFLATGCDEEQAGSAAEIVGKILAMVLFVRARVETKDDAPAATGLVGSCLAAVLLVGGRGDSDVDARS